MNQINNQPTKANDGYVVNKLLQRKGNIYYDFGTNNLSFKQVAKDLKTNGVENYYFHLALYNPRLSGVDPHNIDETDAKLVMEITQECILNPYYFVREVARIPVQGGTGIPFQLNRATLAVLWCFLHNIDSYITISRQIGKTQSVLTYILWAFMFGASNSAIGFLCIDQTKANENLTRLKAQYELLPTWLQANFTLTDRGTKSSGKNSVQQLENIINNNKITTKGKATSAESADNIGRGSTEPIQYIDEFEFVLYISRILKASGPAFVTAHENAVKNNSASARIFSSTPGDLDSRAGSDAIGLINNMYKWTEAFYSMDINDVIATIDKSSNGIVYIEFPYYLLGKGEKYFKAQCKVLDNDPIAIKREILLKRIHGSTDSPYDIEDLDVIDQSRGKIIEEYFFFKIYKLNIYERIDPSRIYFIGIDPSDGYGADSNTLIIFDPYKLRNVAEFESPYISHTDFTNLIITLILKRVPNGIIIIERNKGAALINSLMESPVRHRLYCEPPKPINNEDKLDAKGLIKMEASNRRLYGVYTGRDTRPLMFSLLEVYIREKKNAFVLNGLISQILGLVRKSTGKIEAGPGFHDDLVMAFLMCLFVYYHGNNLSRYGFYPGELPDEEERNKGVNYEDINLIKDSLSENDLAFFGGDIKEEKSVSQIDNDYMDKMNRLRREIDNQLNNYGVSNDSVMKAQFSYTEDDYMQSPLSSDLFNELNNPY